MELGNCYGTTMELLHVRYWPSRRPSMVLVYPATIPATRESATALVYAAMSLGTDVWRLSRRSTTKSGRISNSTQNSLKNS
eukprot:3647902-Rhodomonas_salina.2